MRQAKDKEREKLRIDVLFSICRLAQGILRQGESMQIYKKNSAMFGAPIEGKKPKRKMV
jgi:hypothetical protein